MRKSSRFFMVMLCIGLMIFGGGTYFMLHASAGDNLVSYSFDFGSNGVEDGYIGVSASDAYNSDKGYGFNKVSSMKNVTASGTGALSDAVQFIESGATSENTFNLDLPNGLYQITVTLGNTARTSVAAEGVLQLINLTGNNATETFRLPVTDGQLNILVTAGKEGYAYTLSALEVKQISDDATMKQTIWICGDSTVCNYYPKESSAMVGWGQVFNQYVDTNVFEVRNMAASGQYAKGFVDAGQFEVIEKYGKKGDYYFISIGINDTNYSNETEYYNVVSDMTKRAKEKGITVILVKQQGRASDVTNHPNLTGRWFGGVLDQIGEEQQVQVVDLFTKALSYYKSIGQEETNALFYDDLHHNKYGAAVLARLISESVTFEVIENNNSASGDDSKDNTNDTTDNNSNSTEVTDLGIYTIKSVNSGMYLAAESDVPANRLNVVQCNTTELTEKCKWKITQDSNGYCYIYSMLGDGSTYLLDVKDGSDANQANIQIHTNTNSDAQLFKLVESSEGIYNILTKASGDSKCLDVAKKSKEDGANVIQYRSKDSANQQWIIEEITLINDNTSIDENTSQDDNNDEISSDDSNDNTQNDSNNEEYVSENPTLYIIGDSTACNYNASYYPQAGWGQMIGSYLPNNYTVSNYAIGGRSSRKFVEEGRWETVYNLLQPGDYVLVQFGINDANYNSSDRYTPTDGTFQKYMAQFAKESLSKQATPIFLTPVLGLGSYSNGKFVNSYSDYCQATKDVAAEYNIACIDVNSLMVENYNNIGYDNAYYYHMISSSETSTDKTHFTEAGADNAAKIIADALVEYIK